MIGLAQKVALEHTLAGSLTGARAFEWLDEVRRMPLHKANCLVLSMGQVHEIDASGITSLVRVHTHLARMGAKLVLENVDDLLTERLEREGLTREIPINSDATPVPVARSARRLRALA